MVGWIRHTKFYLEHVLHTSRWFSGTRRTVGRVEDMREMLRTGDRGLRT